jgi:hypothetical protein
LPFDKLKALSVAEGLEVYPEPCLFTPPLQQEGGASRGRTGELRDMYVKPAKEAMEKEFKKA